jgi:hypothetical protein
MAVRLSGLDGSFTLPWVTAREAVLGPGAGISDPLTDFCACRAKLGGIYSFFVAACGCDESAVSAPSPAVVLALSEPSTLARTASTMVFRTPFFASSRLRSARAASEAPGPVKRVTTEVLAVSRTAESLSSRALTRIGR